MRDGWLDYVILPCVLVVAVVVVLIVTRMM
jgi:hypothetical protein